MKRQYFRSSEILQKRLQDARQLQTKREQFSENWPWLRSEGFSTDFKCFICSKKHNSYEKMKPCILKHIEQKIKAGEI